MWYACTRVLLSLLQVAVAPVARRVPPSGRPPWTRQGCTTAACGADSPCRASGDGRGRLRRGQRRRRRGRPRSRLVLVEGVRQMRPALELRVVKMEFLRDLAPVLRVEVVVSTALVRRGLLHEPETRRLRYPHLLLHVIPPFPGVPVSWNTSHLIHFHSSLSSFTLFFSRFADRATRRGQTLGEK
jgi:hypothetical protein